MSSLLEFSHPTSTGANHTQAILEFFGSHRPKSFLFAISAGLVSEPFQKTRIEETREGRPKSKEKSRQFILEPDVAESPGFLAAHQRWRRHRGTMGAVPRRCPR